MDQIFSIQWAFKCLFFLDHQKKKIANNLVPKIIFFNTSYHLIKVTFYQSATLFEGMTPDCTSSPAIILVKSLGCQQTRGATKQPDSELCTYFVSFDHYH